MRMTLARMLLVSSAVTLSLSAWPANSYRIVLHQVHETLTRAAVDCLEKAQGAAPANCALDRQALRALSGRNNSEYKAAVRWPDNPQRQSNPVSGVHNLINVVAGRCADLLEENPDNLQAAGLACRGHWGDLQFFHAQRSSPTEKTADTRTKILDWARFTYNVAAGNVRPDANFCDQFRGGSQIDGSMIPQNFPYCAADDSGWTVGEFFTLSCPTNPFVCNTDARDGPVRNAATGAILHVIQDSYSQSHVIRTDNVVRNRRGVAKPVMECGAPREYTHYNRATAGDHGKADAWPVLGATCGSGAERHDAITASATALYYLRQGRSADQFVEYLSTHVF